MPSIIKNQLNSQSNVPGDDEATPPEETGQESASGHMPDLSTDDNIDELVENMDLYQSDDDEAMPQPVNIAAQVEKAERDLRKNDSPSGDVSNDV